MLRLIRQLTFTALVAGFSMQALAACDLPTYRAMQDASEAALNNRMNAIDSNFSNLRNLRPSQLACLDKFMGLSFGDLISNFSVGSIIRSMMDGIANQLANMACTATNDAWTQTVNPINQMTSGVTLPGGTGTVKVGVNVGNDGKLSAGVLSAPGSSTTGLIDQGYSWMKNGMTRAQSWFK